MRAIGHRGVHGGAQFTAQCRIERIHRRPREPQFVDGTVAVMGDEWRHARRQFDRSAIIGAMTIARLAAVLLLAAAPAVHAADCLPVVESPWIRKPPMAMPMMAGFATVRNPCPAPVTLVGASSTVFESVELHETRTVEGMSRMRHVEALEVPAGGEVTLAPGGLHLMLMRPRAAVEAGGAIEVELSLADGRTLRADFEVRDAAGR